jgi:hypothetical protein
LRRIFGPKRDGVMGGWRRLHNEELHNSYCSQYNQNDQVKDDARDKTCNMNWEKNAYRILVGKSEGKRPLEGPRCRYVDNIKRDIGWGAMDWIDLVQDTDQWRALANNIKNLWVS